MQVKDVMTCDVEMVDSDATLVDVAEGMRSLDVGALPVCEDDKIVGIITDRDITIRAVAEGLDPAETLVSEIMTSDIYYCYEDNDISEAAKLMEEQSIRRLLVMDSDNNPVGFLSLGDVCVKSHDEHLSYEILEQISEPACPCR